MKILLLQLKRIGDLILTTPAIAALRNAYPDAHITLAVSNECADLLPAISNVDHILIARRNLRDVAMVSCVAGNRFDYCIDFTRNDRSAFLTLLSAARRRVASVAGKPPLLFTRENSSPATEANRRFDFDHARDRRLA